MKQSKNWGHIICFSQKELWIVPWSARLPRTQAKWRVQNSSRQAVTNNWSLNLFRWNTSLGGDGICYKGDIASWWNLKNRQTSVLCEDREVCTSGGDRSLILYDHVSVSRSTGSCTFHKYITRIVYIQALWRSLCFPFSTFQTPLALSPEQLWSNNLTTLEFKKN